MTRVLAADDHPLMLSGIEAILQPTRYKLVSKVSEGLMVLAEVERTRPDIILLDVNMPGRGGIDVLRDLQAVRPEVHVVLLTASLDDESLNEAVALGVRGILLKDGGQRSLIQCLDEVSKGRRWIERSLLDRTSGAKAAKACDPLTLLTQSELGVATLVAQGLRNRSIAEETGLTEGTVKVYLNRIYEKLGVSNRTELALKVRWNIK